MQLQAFVHGPLSPAARLGTELPTWFALSKHVMRKDVFSYLQGGVERLSSLPANMPILNRESSSTHRRWKG
jgi:hypothetical protein